MDFRFFGTSRRRPRTLAATLLALATGGALLVACSDDGATPSPAPPAGVDAGRDGSLSDASVVEADAKAPDATLGDAGDGSDAGPDARSPSCEGDTQCAAADAEYLDAGLVQPEASVPTPTGAGGQLDGGGVRCTGRDPSGAPSAPYISVLGEPPSATGGAVVAGAYHLIATTVYVLADAGTFDLGPEQRTLDLSSSTFGFEQSPYAPGSDRTSAGTYATSGNELRMWRSCPGTAIEDYFFDATPTSVTLYERTANTLCVGVGQVFECMFSWRYER